MPALWTPTRAPLVKPPPGTPVDLGHPLARELWGSWLFLRRRQAGALRYAENAPGLGNFAGTDDTRRDVMRDALLKDAIPDNVPGGGIRATGGLNDAGVIPNALPPQLCTTLAIVTPALSGILATLVNRAISLDSYAVEMGLQTMGAGNYRFWNHDGAVGTILLDGPTTGSLAPQAGRKDVLVGVRDRTTHSLYVNGALAATGPFTSTNVVGWTTLVHHLLYQSDLQQSAPAGTLMHHYAHWNRALCPEEVAWVTREPYAYFLPVGRRSFHLPPPTHTDAVVTGAGGMVLGGAGVAQLVLAARGAGGAVLGGAAAAQLALAAAGIGGELLTGAAAAQLAVSATGSGTLIFGGGAHAELPYVGPPRRGQVYTTPPAPSYTTPPAGAYQEGDPT